MGDKSVAAREKSKEGQWSREEEDWGGVLGGAPGKNHDFNDIRYFICFLIIS